MIPAVLVLLSCMAVLAQGVIVDPVTAAIALKGDIRTPFGFGRFTGTTGPLSLIGRSRTAFGIDDFDLGFGPFDVIGKRCIGGVCFPDTITDDCIGGDCDMLTGDVVKKALFVDVARKLQKAKLLEQLNAEINLGTNKGLWHTMDSTIDKVCGPGGCIFTRKPTLNLLTGGIF
ncbi:unnamed protein product [Acanthoscelides obtectus]|uniref:Uncharacterized protein n=1 Tax=Acanthoscelides obtectus TaxID=200917 RepID=A0A9P0K0B0_ACAOB|nr:unnamed protein product [Acanthoscelides obtectus]CAK1633836.1 hypothetical protein AOBTE_LOCUS8423 [Acanthoscelides obtectus]